MRPELGKSQFHAPIFDGAKVEEAARAMPVGEVSVSSLLETFPVLMWATTPDGVPWYLNQRCVEYTGRSLSDTLSLGWVDVIHPEDREETVRAWSHAVSSGSSHHVKQRLRRADGEYQWFLTLAEPLRDREGRAIHFVGLSVDINESVKREAEIRRLFGANIVGIVFWEIDGEIRDANDAFLRMVGYERADVVSGRLRWTDLMTAEWLKLDCEYAEQRVRLTESVQPYETEFLRKNGSRVPVLIGGAAFDAEIKHRVTFVVDITARKRAEEESRRSQHYLAEAQRLSQTGSFGWRPDSGEVIWSAETYRIFEYDRAVTPTIDLVVQRVHPEDRAEFQSVIERAFEGASDFEHAYRLLLPDGRAKYVRALAHATRDASGNREFVGAVTDMTDPKRAEESLRASEAYLAEAQRLSRTGSWAWSPDEDIRYWSEECYRVLSFDPNDGLPRFEEFFQRIHPDDQPRCKELAGC